MPTRPIFEVEAARAERIVNGSKPIEEMRDRLLVDIKAIDDECEGYPRLFRLAGGLDEEVEIDAGISRAARMLPGVHVPAGALQHDTEHDVFS